MKLAAVFAVATVALCGAPAVALGLRADALSAVTVDPPPHASVPLNARFRDPEGKPHALAGDTGGPPRVLVFADYACATLCGPALSIVAARLGETGLRAGVDYALEVVGLDPVSTPAQAARFGAERLPNGPDADLLTGDAEAIRAATTALGYRYAFDPATHAFAHPVAAFVLTPDGRLVRVLSEVAIRPDDLKTALDEARRGVALGLVEALAIACHGALKAAGAFDKPVLLVLRLGGLATVVGGAGALAFLSRRSPRARS